MTKNYSDNDNETVYKQPIHIVSFHLYISTQFCWFVVENTCNSCGSALKARILIMWKMKRWHLVVKPERLSRCVKHVWCFCTWQAIYYTLCTYFSVARRHIVNEWCTAAAGLCVCVYQQQDEEQCHGNWKAAIAFKQERPWPVWPKENSIVEIEQMMIIFGSCIRLAQGWNVDREKEQYPFFILLRLGVTLSRLY